MSLAPSKEEIHKLFTRFDLNNDNTIDADELRAALTELGVSTTDVNRAEAVLRAYDTDNNKTLDEAEFGDLLGQLSSYLREADLRDIRRRKKHQIRRAAKAVEKQGRKITGSKSYLEALQQFKTGGASPEAFMNSLVPTTGTVAGFIVGGDDGSSSSTKDKYSTTKDRQKKTGTSDRYGKDRKTSTTTRGRTTTTTARGKTRGSSSYSSSYGRSNDYEDDDYYKDDRFDLGSDEEKEEDDEYDRGMLSGDDGGYQSEKSAFSLGGGGTSKNKSLGGFMNRTIGKDGKKKTKHQ